MSLEAWLPLIGSGTATRPTNEREEEDHGEGDFSVTSEPPTPVDEIVDEYYAEVARRLEGVNEAPAQRQAFGVAFDEL